MKRGFVERMKRFLHKMFVQETNEEGKIPCHHHFGRTEDGRCTVCDEFVRD